MASEATKSVFITGAAGGLGAATVKVFAQQGWQVFAGDINPTALDALSPNIQRLQVDVTQTESVAQAFARIAETVSGLDAVINFAGVLVTGSVAEIPEEQLTRLLDINVLGTFRVNKAALPLVLARKGRIINISSETGWQSGAPFNGPYAMSKHAIEAYSDSLRRELAFLGVAVIKIQPGAFKTDMVASIEKVFDRAIEQSTYFKPHLEKIKALGSKEQRKARPPEELANAVYAAVVAPSPKAAYSVKPDLGRSFFEKLPTRFADSLLLKILKP